MKKSLTLILSFIFSYALLNAQNNHEDLWKIISYDTFPYNYQYKNESITAQKMLEELNGHLDIHSEDYNYVLKTTFIYEALAGNYSVLDSLIKIQANQIVNIKDELVATKLLIQYLTNIQDPNSIEGKKKNQELVAYLNTHSISDDPNEAMKWHWISKMLQDSVLIQHNNPDFSYIQQLNDSDNPSEFSGAILATHRFPNSQNILISNSHFQPIRLMEMDRKGAWKDITQEAHLDSIPGGQRMYAVDINNDGWQDILILRKMTSASSRTTLYPSLLVNQGDGTYKDVAKPAGLDVPQRANCACFLDANEDGKLDIFIGNENYNSALFLQNDNLQFEESSGALGIITKPYKIRDCAVIDINNDRHPDLLLSTYNFSNFTYVYQKINDEYPFFINKAYENGSNIPYKGGIFMQGDYDGNQDENIISNTDHSTNDKDVIFNILSGTYGPEEFPVMWKTDTFDLNHSVEQYSLLTYANSYLNIDKGESRPFILFGGGKSWDELYPLTFYQFLDDHYFYQLEYFKKQPLYINSMTITPNFKTQQPLIWMKGGGVNTILKNKISTYIQTAHGGSFYTLYLIGKSRPDALGSKITVTTKDANGKIIKRTRTIQVVDSQGGGAGQDIWFLPEGAKFQTIQIDWNDGTSTTYNDFKFKKNTLTITQE